jgi:hypothetical protein
LVISCPVFTPVYTLPQWSLAALKQKSLTTKQSFLSDKPYPFVFLKNNREHPHIGNRQAVSVPDVRVLAEKTIDACLLHRCPVIGVYPAARQCFTGGELQTILAESGRFLHFFTGVETPLQLRHTRIDHRRAIQHFHQITSRLISEVHDILLR